MLLSFGKRKSDIIRYIIIALLFITGIILTWGSGPESIIFYLLLLFLSSTTIIISSKKAIITDIIFPLYAFVVGSFIDHWVSLYQNTFLELFGTKSTLIYSLFVNELSGYAVEFFIILALYFLARALWASPVVAAIIAPVPTILLTLINYYVLTFRGNELSPSDFLGAKTALNVVAGYSFQLRVPLALALFPLILYGISLTRVKTTAPSSTSSQSRLACALTFAVMVVALLVSVNSISRSKKPEYLSNNPSRMNGFITNFALQVKNLRVEKPANYNKDDYAQLYTAPEITSEADDVNIIVIMNESLADMSIYSDLTGDYEDTLPFYRSLQGAPNVITGYAYASVFGGSTCNSEFEMLTGLSTAELPKGAMPYSMYLSNPHYSLARYLKERGYSTTAMHPFLSTSWNRTVAYPSLGFDKSMFIQDFSYGAEDIIRGSSNLNDNVGFMSDECAYRNLLDLTNNNKTGAPEFYFMVTIQNHGGHSSDQEKNPITNYASGTTNDDELNSYLTNARRSDEALEMLLGELSTSNKKYVVLIFGDHQPNLELLQEEDASAGARKWLVPYLIWTNYDMAPDLSGVRTTSINYLAIDVLNAAGIPLSNYFQELSSIREAIPVINSAGYYSDSTKSWHNLDDKEDSSSQEMLTKYNSIMYYSLFDSEY